MGKQDSECRRRLASPYRRCLAGSEAYSHVSHGSLRIDVGLGSGYCFRIVGDFAAWSASVVGILVLGITVFSWLIGIIHVVTRSRRVLSLGQKVFWILVNFFIPIVGPMTYSIYAIVTF